jgi:Na+/H+ antiporter NhaA
VRSQACDIDLSASRDGADVAATASLTGHTAWARNLAAPARDFLNTETGGAVVLAGAAFVALLWSNSPWSTSYESVWSTQLSLRLGHAGVAHDLRHWINDGLMTFYFLVVGLEAKRELDTGLLRERRRIALPAIAALGGMAVPVLIYLALNAGGPGEHGWGAAMSTDTAFALGLLALVAPGGTRLRVRLLTLAVADDLAALVVIALAYTGNVAFGPLALAAGLFGLLLALRYAPGAWRGPAATTLGVGMWLALDNSGIDPVVAGLAVGLVTTAYEPSRRDLERVVELTRSFREQPTPELARSAQIGVASAISSNDRLQYRLHPWTSFVIVPLFALANAGVDVDARLLAAAATSPITLGIVCGYVLGKPLGIVGATWIGSKLWHGRLPRVLSWPAIAAGGVVAGIGFTVSLLILNLAFQGRQLQEAKLALLASTVIAACLAWGIFRLLARLPARVRARQLMRTDDEIVDLANDVDPERDHIRGVPDAPVTLVEYGDYECPYCGQAEVVIDELVRSFGDDLRYVWRHLPLNDVHPNAQAAAEATEAAAAQGAFWEMHDRLLAHQDELAPGDLARHAADLGLDVERFWNELKGRQYEPRVAEDVASADASGVAGTPSFFINGRRHRGEYDVTALDAAVRAARARAALARQAA